MNWNSTTRRSLNRRGQRAFTFAEVLAALVFMAIVIPVVLQGLTLGNRASVIAERKHEATQLAQNRMRQLTLSNEWRYASSVGVFDPPMEQYQWRVHQEAWREDAMQLLTVEVLYQVQGREYSVPLSTLVDDSQI